MSNLIPKRVGLAFGLFIAIIAMPAYAIFPKLSTTLVGQVQINGVIPSGSASINQAKYPSKPGVVSVKVSKVNLADGAVLSVYLSDCSWYGAVAFLKVVGGTASISATLPQTCQIGRSSKITVMNQTTILLTGGYPWDI